jgi:peroxiredoxin
LEVIGVDVGETPEQVKAFTQRMAVQFPLLIDEHGEAFDAWKVYAFPTTFIIDRQGWIRFAVYGGMDWTDSDVIKQIKALLEN